MINATPSFTKIAGFQNVFPPHEKETPAFLKFLQFEERFRDGLVRTAGLTV